MLLVQVLTEVLRDEITRGKVAGLPLSQVSGRLRVGGEIRGIGWLRGGEGGREGREGGREGGRGGGREGGKAFNLELHENKILEAPLITIL